MEKERGREERKLENIEGIHRPVSGVSVTAHRMMNLF